jgi:hypothetical protein
MTLPPADAPLAMHFPALVRAARAGDVGAQCRVAMEVQRCTVGLANARERVQLQTEYLEEGSPGALVGGADLLARSIAKLETSEEICAGIDVPADLEPWRLLLAAAQDGHVASMLNYLADYPLDKRDLLQHLDQLEVYRDQAPVLLERAAASGDPYGAQAMFWALQGQPAFLMPSFEPTPRDPVRLLAYTLALQDVMDAKGRERLVLIEGRLRRKLPDASEREAEGQSAVIAKTLAASRGMDMKFGLDGTFKPGADCSRP